MRAQHVACGTGRRARSRGTRRDLSLLPQPLLLLPPQLLGLARCTLCALPLLQDLPSVHLVPGGTGGRREGRNDASMFSRGGRVDRGAVSLGKRALQRALQRPPSSPGGQPTGDPLHRCRGRLSWSLPRPSPSSGPACSLSCARSNLPAVPVARDFMWEKQPPPPVPAPCVRGTAGTAGGSRMIHARALRRCRPCASRGQVLRSLPRWCGAGGRAPSATCMPAAPWSESWACLLRSLSSRATWAPIPSILPVASTGICASVPCEELRWHCGMLGRAYAGVLCMQARCKPCSPARRGRYRCRSWIRAARCVPARRRRSRRRGARARVACEAPAPGHQSAAPSFCLHFHCRW